MDSEPKGFLFQFFYDLIENKKFENVFYLNKNEFIFQIPWPRYDKEKDGSIYFEYEKYRRNNEKIKTWNFTESKHRLRVALNKNPYLKILKSNDLKNLNLKTTTNQCKIIQFDKEKIFNFALKMKEESEKREKEIEEFNIESEDDEVEVIYKFSVDKFKYPCLPFEMKDEKKIHIYSDKTKDTKQQKINDIDKEIFLEKSELNLIINKNYHNFQIVNMSENFLFINNEKFRRGEQKTFKSKKKEKIILYAESSLVELKVEVVMEKQNYEFFPNEQEEERIQELEIFEEFGIMI